MTVMVIGRVVWIGGLTFKTFETAEQARAWAAQVSKGATQ